MKVGDDLDDGLPGPRLVGVVWNAWSARPFDIVVYEDGLLLIHGHVLDFARPLFRLTPTVLTYGRRTPLEENQELRLVELRALSRPALLTTQPDASFIPTREIREVLYETAPASAGSASRPRPAASGPSCGLPQ
ncbi:hypothetical protein ACSMXN_07545 [Jatrophihabitans sp. DSM 45814]